MLNLGIIYAIIALFAWGCGDFLLERTTRKIGNVATLFWVCLFGLVSLTPFVWSELSQFGSSVKPHLVLLTLTASVLFAGSMFDLQALKIGKLSVMEPIYALEIMFATGLGVVFVNELPTLSQGVWGAVMITAIGLVSIPTFKRNWLKLERGVWFALASAVLMGVVNFLTGVSARATTAFFINWFNCVLVVLIFGVYFLFKGFPGGLKSSRAHWGLIVSTSAVDIIAWVAFAASTTFIYIGLATAISEAYIALAALLGIILNKEKLRKHQYVGIVLALIAAVALSYIH